MKKIFLVLTLFLLFTFTVNAQDYNTAIGVRAGSSNGLTVKHFIGNNKALEGLLLTRWQGFHITGLYEIHNIAFDTPRLNWYYGVGGHIGFWDGNDIPWVDNNNDQTIIGIDGIIGIEYNFESIPFNVSLDWKPGLNLIGYTGFWGNEVAFSLRYIF